MNEDDEDRYADERREDRIRKAAFHALMRPEHERSHADELALEYFNYKGEDNG